MTDQTVEWVVTGEADATTGDHSCDYDHDPDAPCPGAADKENGE